MFMTNEDYEVHDRLFNGLDNSRAQDFMGLLMLECGRKTGNDEWMITIRSAAEIVALGVPQNEIITLEMVYAAYYEATGVKLP